MNVVDVADVTCRDVQEHCIASKTKQLCAMCRNRLCCVGKQDLGIVLGKSQRGRNLAGARQWLETSQHSKEARAG